jgi:two-component SAPR family response regulator
LQRHGFDAAFNDPRQALTQFKENYYNIILLDVKMSCTIGFDVAKQIQDIEADAKNLFFSAFEMYERAARVCSKT